MKHLFILFTISILYSTNIKAQWEQQNPSLPGEQFHDMHYFDEHEGVIVGALGQILRTEDGGISWEATDTETQESLYAVDFIDDRLGWAVGTEGTIISTKNGGRSWRGENIDTDNDLKAIAFYDDHLGCVVGNNSTVAITIDQGENWTTNEVIADTDFSSISFVNDSTIFIAGLGGVIMKLSLRVSNGIIVEQNIQQTPISSTIKDIFFTNENNGWAVGVLGTLLSTTDGGNTWIEQTIDLPNYQESLDKIIFSDLNTGWIYGSKSNIWKTTNRGEEWSLVTTINNTFGIEAIFLLNEQNMWLLGDQGIFKSINSGIDWERLSKGTTEYFLDVFFIDDTIGYVCGTNGVILKTKNGGEQWYIVRDAILSQPDLRRIFFLNEAEGWAVGNNGTILKTSNGGELWVPQVSGTTNDLWGVHFPDASRGWAVGKNYTVLQFDENENSWSVFNPNDEPYLIADVFFTDFDTGWIIVRGSQGGYVAKTDDGFSSNVSQQIAQNGSRDLNSIQVVDGIGWIVGENGKVYKSTGEGLNWQTIGIPGASNLNDLSFVDANKGWIAGFGGRIFNTKDGGITWEQENQITTNNINGIHFINEEEGWAVGSHGTILHYEQPIPCRVRDSLTLLKLKSAMKIDDWNIINPIDTWPGGVYFNGEEGCVTSLYLNNKELDGYIPPEIGDLRDLRVLNLKNNQLHGNIPEEIGKMTKLTTINLYDNDLSGKIPESLGYLSDLEMLNLDSNLLSGTIPASLGYLYELEELHLTINDLTGPIPAKLGQLSKLQSLFLSNNELDGKIPPELGQLSKLAILSLKDNDLSGSIPPELGQLQNLSILRLNNNQLSGPLAPELTNMVGLFEFHAYNNQLSGCYPEEFGIVFCGFPPQQFRFENNPDLPDFRLFCEEGVGQCKELTIIDTLCYDDSLLGFNRLQPSGRIHDQDSLIMVELTFEIPDTTFINEELCWGSGIQIGDQWYSCLQQQDQQIEDQLILANQNGCDSIINIKLNCLACNQQSLEEIPTAFTPNGDGFNDYFVLPMLITDPANFPDDELRVFDAHSRLVYQQEDYDNQWEGTDIEGNGLPLGTYYFYFTHSNGEIIKGVISIIR